MRILAVDIGMGTQDILLFDSSKLLENCVQMIMPSPTTIVASKIHQATVRHHPIFLNGVTMGGGPNGLALAKHTAAGLPAYATVEAALTFNDDLELVKSMGVTILTSDEIPHTPDLEVIELKDVDLGTIRRCLGAFGIDDGIDALAVAVLDHGFAPDISNRLFRFDHLRSVFEKKRELIALCYLAEELPDYLTRMKSVVKSVGTTIPLLITETGVAAVLGALQDEEVIKHNHLLIANIGNGHTIAFHLLNNLIEGLFEHHTSLVNTTLLDSLFVKLAQGDLTNEEIYNAGGHGAIVFNGEKLSPFITITGPRRELMNGSSLKPYRAVPYGSVMLTGCYGLIKACALRMSDWSEEIMFTLTRRT